MKQSTMIKLPDKESHFLKHLQKLNPSIEKTGGFVGKFSSESRA